MFPRIFAALSQGFQLLPLFVVGVETLAGKQTGATKKQAVTALVNASIAGTAIGLDAAGSQQLANSVATMGPIISAVIDQTVSNFNKYGWAALNYPPVAVLPQPPQPPQPIQGKPQPVPAVPQQPATVPQEASSGTDGGMLRS